LDTGIIIKNQNQKYNIKNSIILKNHWILTFWKVFIHKRRFRRSIQRSKNLTKNERGHEIDFRTGINRLKTETENKIKNEIRKN